MVFLETIQVGLQRVLLIFFVVLGTFYTRDLHAEGSSSESRFKLYNYPPHHHIYVWYILYDMISMERSLSICTQ